MRSHPPKARTRQALWNIKQERPQLFANKDQQLSSELDPPDRNPGFEPFGREGWLRHPGRNLYLEEATGRLCWFDAPANEYRDFREGEALPLHFAGGAATWLASAGSTAAVEVPPACSACGKQPPALLKHVVIPDLHRVAQALKADLSHLDRPSGMLAVFGPGSGPGSGGAAAAASASSSGVQVDVAARVFHERLIRRLAASRSDWSDEELQASLVSTLDDLADSHSGARPAAAVALAIGHRVLAAAAPGACFGILGVGPTLDVIGSAAAPEKGTAVAAACHGLDPSPTAALGVVVMVGDLHSGDMKLAATVGPQLAQGRPRAAGVALLKAARSHGAHGHLAVACARLMPTRAAAAAIARELSAADPPSKRQRLDVTHRKVRVRQILLRHWRGVGPQPVDPVRRVPVTRSPEEAEAQLLGVLDGLAGGGCAGFSGLCKGLSECPSALKGGELAGDLGWLDTVKEKEDQPGKKTNPTPAIKSAIPLVVRKAAFDLEVAELGDLISSEIGVHLLLRTA